MAGLQALRLNRPAADVKAATLAALATGKGVVHAPNYATADKSGWCGRPIVIDQEGDGHWAVNPAGFPVREPSRTLSLQVRCRKCEGCLKERRCMWANRAVSEWQEADKRGGRTWFLTLTFRPEEHYRLKTQARLRVAAAGGDLDAMSWSERYGEFLREYHATVSLFLARVRKGLAKRGWSEGKFRYLMVPEPHESGNIHYHALLHEFSDDYPLRKLRIEQAWGLGFIQAKLVGSPEATRYVTKYLGKHHYEGRIRNSLHYGKERQVEPPHPEVADFSMREWLWQSERDPCAEGKGKVVDLRGAAAPLSARALEVEAAQRVASDELAHELKRAPVAGDMTPRRSDPGPVEIADRAVRDAVAFAHADDEGIDPVRIGDKLGVCPSGLHIGGGCDCKAESHGLECLPEPDEYRGGVPRRKWELRGWHEPAPGRGGPGMSRQPYRKRSASGETQH